MEKNTGKGMNLLQKLYRYRLKIDRKGTTIVNLSSLFCIPCLLLAPHMSIAGIIISLVLGYHISLESEGDTGDLEETLRNAAETVKQTASSAAKTIRQEIDKARSSGAPAARQSPAEAPETAAPAQAPAPQEIQVTPRASGEEIVEDLKEHMDREFHGNPAVYHTAFTASGSVPTLHVPEADSSSEDPQSARTGYQG